MCSQHMENENTIAKIPKIMFNNYVNSHFRFICFRKLKFSSCSVLRSSLCGRDVLQPEDLTVNDWKRVLWYAVDLKQLHQRQKEGISIIPNKHVTLLFLKPSGLNLLSCSFACQLTGAKSTFYSDPDLNSISNFHDSGRALSQITDLILANGCQQEALSKLAEGSRAPVVGLSSNMYSLIRALAFLMTVYEQFGCLKRLKLAWVGPSTPLCNTILSIFPLFGVNLKLCCICAHGLGPTSPVMYGNAILACNRGSTEIHQSSSAAEAVYRSHVIVTTGHSDEGNKITNELIEEAELEWIFLHPLPRTEVEVSDDIFKHKNNVTWQACENHLYIAMAFIISALSGYEPSSPMPQFQGS